MRVPLDWLAEWIDLPASQADLVERLTVGGLEIEHVEQDGPDLSGLVVGLVVEHGRHPDADRLSLCRVDTGDGDPVEVVCGAPNVAAGQKIAFAATGTRLPDGTKLKKSKIRGVVSNGMICSARELGLGDDHSGILVLDPGARIGAPLSEVLAPAGAVLDVEITPNRGDWASLLGFAREVRSHYGGELRLPECTPPESGPPAADAVRVEIDDAGGCSHYVARIVRGVRVGPSPDWLAAKLEAAGQRPINVLVDITNLVLLEFGQPLHAFDLDTLQGGVIRVRPAEAGEKIETLDGQIRELAADDLVIADAGRAVAVAGVMGGAETEVSDRTLDVLIESARFHPTRVRRTARRLGLHSEASYRFERGVDPAGVVRAADRAARLMAELCGGRVDAGIAEAHGDVFPHTDVMSVHPDRVNRLLGTDLDAEAVADCLRRADFEVTPGEGGALRAAVPSWRHDVLGAEDLVEEVARIHGYDRIPATLPRGDLQPVARTRRRELVEGARTSLAGQGLCEAVTRPFAAESDPDRLSLPEDDPRRRLVRLANPIVEEECTLRTSLVPSLLRAVQANQARQAGEVRIFEIGPAFLARAGLPEEPWGLVAVITRGDDGLWGPRDPIPLFFLAKGVAERVLFDLGYAAWFRSEAEPGEVPYLHPGAATRVGVGEQVVGSVGEIHPDTAMRFGIDGPCALVELDLDALEQIPVSQPEFRDVSRQPSVRRDLAVVLDTDTPAGDVLAAIARSGGAHLVSVELFDRYAGKGVPEGKHSLAFRLVFQHPDKTLTDAEIAKATDRVVRMLDKRFGGQLR